MVSGFACDKCGKFVSYKCNKWARVNMEELNGRYESIDNYQTKDYEFCIDYWNTNQTLVKKE